MFERFTRSAREAVVWAEEAGRRDGATHIESGYLLLGAVHLDGSVAARALGEHHTLCALFVERHPSSSSAIVVSPALDEQLRHSANCQHELTPRGVST